MSNPNKLPSTLAEWVAPAQAVHVVSALSTTLGAPPAGPLAMWPLDPALDACRNALAATSLPPRGQARQVAMLHLLGRVTAYTRLLCPGPGWVVEPATSEQLANAWLRWTREADRFSLVDVLRCPAGPALLLDGRTDDVVRGLAGTAEVVRVCHLKAPRRSVVVAGELPVELSRKQQGLGSVPLVPVPAAEVVEVA